MPETELYKAARDGSVDEVGMIIQEGKIDINERGAQGALRGAAPTRATANQEPPALRPRPRGAC